VSNKELNTDGLTFLEDGEVLYNDLYPYLIMFYAYIKGAM